MKREALAEYRPFVAKLRAAGVDWTRSDVSALLDGAAGEALRKSVPLTTRQRVGAFFTPTALADRCLEQLPGIPTPITDPACGAGDLLLAAARRLPISRSAVETLKVWGQCLVGTDVVPEFVAAAKLRLALLAMQRTGDRIDIRLANRLLSNIRVGNGLASLGAETIGGLLFINPPFGTTTTYQRHFNGAGRVSRAGIFADKAIRALAPEAWIAAILPDVLRSGTTYSRWRRSVSQQLGEVVVSVEGKFDATTDVDVFTLVGRRGHVPENGAQRINWYQTTPPSDSRTIGDVFELHVGHIVAYRDQGGGTDRAFVTVRDLVSGAIQSRLTNHWPAGKRVVPTPFVAICRTSSPDDPRRVVASVISGRRPVAVENHIITAQPRSRTLEDAIKLMKWLRSPLITAQLQRRIRCRHLTLDALRDLPWPDAT